jgi:hypothetical protein
MRLVLFAVTLILAAFLNSGSAFAVTSGVSANHAQGVMLVGDGLAGCKAATTGAIRYNSTTPNIEFCDGANWRHAAQFTYTPPAGYTGWGD